MKILFWNLFRKDLSEHIAELTELTEADIIVTVENHIPPSVLTKRLCNVGIGTFIEAWNFTDAVKIFTRLPAVNVKNLADDGRVTARRVTPIIGSHFNLIALHLPSKMWRTNADQAAWISSILRPFITNVEQQEGHKRTILIGDFNANPFEEGIIAAMGLHATSCKNVAKKGSRKIDGIESDMFYNPMWSFFGDMSQGPPGTFFHKSSGHHEFFWHMFDQVMIRPALIPFIKDKGVEILTHTGKRSLLNHKSQPDTRNSSDHLPIYLRLAF